MFTSSLGARSFKAHWEPTGSASKNTIPVCPFGEISLDQPQLKVATSAAKFELLFLDVIVSEVSVRTGTTQMLMLRNSNPQTGLEAKFSMEFAMAAALVAGRVA